MASRTLTPVLAAILFGSVLAVVWYGWEPSAPPGLSGTGEDVGSAAGSPEPATAGPTNASGRPQVEVEVQTRYVLEPPAQPLPVTVRRGQQILPATVEVVGGVGSQWPQVDVRPGRALLRIDYAQDVWYRVVRFPAAGSSVDVKLGLAVPLRGRVVDAERRPVQGAAVWCGASLQVLSMTDEDGQFEALVTAGSGIPIVVMAEGLAWSGKVVDWQFDDGSQVTFELGSECRLRVQLQAVVANEGSLLGATASVVPRGGGDTTQQAYPFYALHLFGQGQLDAQGSALLSGLPSTSTVGVLVRGSGLPTTSVVALPLKPGRQEVLVPAIERPRLRGRVVDESGEPVAGVALWSWPKGGKACAFAEDRWLLPPATAVGAVSGVTRADGSFALARPEGEQCVLAMRGLDGTRAQLALVADQAEPLELVMPAWEPAAPELIVPPPLADAPWWVRVAPFASRQSEVGANDAFTFLLPNPQVADLRVRVDPGSGEWSEPNVLRNAVLVGGWNLPATLLDR